MNDQNAKRDGEMLKPCPFCGAPASAWSWNGGQAYAIFSIKRKLMLYLFGIEVIEI